MTRQNEHGQPIGLPLGGWERPEFPPATDLTGRSVTLVPLETAHASNLFSAFSNASDSLWTYMSFGPFPNVNALEETLETMIALEDWLPYSIVVEGRHLGFASYLRIQPGEGVIEIGAITMSPHLQRTTAATEAVFMMIDNAFTLGYRRLEWKCDQLNEPSRRAAIRFGFTYEGTFRQATHYKGRNRDTAWYSIIDGEWPALREAFLSWLDPDNFDTTGRQRRGLAEIREGN
ncbi:MAG TPA: GNAT family protein [Acidimicrobiia bacterium]|nr:GNAT family protein [Acidimicrobiia bacterium]